MPPAAAVGALAVGGMASSYLSGRQRIKGINAGIAAQQYGQQQGTGAVNQYYGEAEKLYQPYEKIGLESTNILADIQGLNGPEARDRALANFRSDPGYQFATGEANRALERSALGRGNIFSGNFMRASNELNQNLADQSFSNYYQRILGLSNMGQEASSRNAALLANRGTALANIYTGTASNLSQLDVAKGESRGNMYGNILSSIGQGAGMYAGMRGRGVNVFSGQGDSTN